ncbi:hypothetical protein NBRC116592_17150 [Colwellia sp. KU-HH00111]|uniref:serine/threonine-protein kinase n=1 Tax=Colwellia sp. KU-HH00111 TaxID=3127652 RepID=UPI0031025CD3
MLDIKTNKIKTVSRNKAKQLSLSFYDTYHSSTESNTINENFKLLFDATYEYFSYIEACNEFIKYLIKLEEQLFHGQGILKYSSEAAIALKNTGAVKWIHGEVSLYRCKSDINVSSLVKKLQKKNELLKIKTGVMKHLYSLTPKRYSVSNLKNKENELKSASLAKIKMFTNLIAMLFKRVVPPKGIEELTTVVLNQYDLPQLECDYFFIIKELLNIYRQENNLQKISNLSELYKQTSTHIITQQKNLEFKSFSELKSVHKHYVIEKLTTFALDEEGLFIVNGNLTQLNKEALIAFSKHKNINNYLNYLDKLWLLGVSRESAKPLLDEDRQLITDNQINLFLGLSFGECLNRIYHCFLKNKTKDTQLEFIERKFIASREITANQLKVLIHKKVKKACSTFKLDNKIPLSRAIFFANAWSTCNRSQSEYSELLSRVILRLIINLEADVDNDHIIATEKAIEEELCCIHRQFYTHYLLGKIFGRNFKDTIEVKYKEFQTDTFSVFRLWLCFLIAQEIKVKKVGSIKAKVDKYFPLFVNNPKKPASYEAFIDSGSKEGQVPETKTLISIEDADLSLYRGSDSKKFEIEKDFESELPDYGIKPIHFTKYTSDEYLSHLWDELLGVDTKELVTLGLIHNFIKVAGDNQEKGIINQYMQSRRELRANFRSTRRQEFFQHINSETFPRIIFNFNKSFEDKLKDKVEVLSHLDSLNSERYVIKNQLGQGAFGVVYKAIDLMFESTVAIKLIPHWFHSEEVSKKLIKEAAIMRNSQHENVVVVYDLVKLPAHKLITDNKCKLNHLHTFDDEEYVFALIMEEVNGGVTLEQYIVSQDWKSLSYEQKLDFFQDICFGVNSLHNQGVVHGDLKPQNILVDKKGKPKISDFGVASDSGDKSIGIASPAFISKNALQGGKSEFQDDIYSLGMLLLYMFSPSIVNEFKGKNVSKLIVEKELLHLALLSLIANPNGDEYSKNGYTHRFDFTSTLLLCTDLNAKHYYQDIVQNIDVNTYDSGKWDEPNPYLFSLLDVIYRCISTKGDKTTNCLYNFINESQPSEVYENIKKQALNVSDIQHINELIFEVKAAARSDVLEFYVSHYRCLTIPTFLNEALTLENLEYYSKNVDFEELCKITGEFIGANHRKPFDVEFLGGTKYIDSNTFLWSVDNKLYRGRAKGLEDYFGDALYKSKLLGVMEQTYGNIFSLVHEVAKLETIPSCCLSLLISIQPFLIYKPFSLGPLKMGYDFRYELPQKLGENITLFDEVKKAYTLYQEVLNVFFNSGKEVDIGFESADASMMQPHPFSGNVIEFNAKLTLSEKLSLIQDDNLIVSIRSFVSTKGNKSFNSFYDSCFDYQELKELVEEWKNLDDENAIDGYIEVKDNYVDSIEYKLLKMYQESGNKEIEIFSR